MIRARPSPKLAFAALRRAFGVFFRKDARFLSAAIAFYALLSAVPLLYLALLCASAVVPGEQAQLALGEGLARMSDRAFADQLTGWVRQERGQLGRGLLGALVFMYSATRLFAALERGLNAMWGLEEHRPVGKVQKVLAQLRTRGLSFVVAIFLGLMLVLTVALKALLAAATVRQWPLVASSAAAFMSWGGTTLGTVAVFFLLYLVLPARRPPWREAVLAAAISAALFMVGVHVVTWYVARHAGFGAGDTLLLLLWLRYAAQVFLFGAAFVHAYLHPDEDSSS
jgi:membrane protein